MNEDTKAYSVMDDEASFIEDFIERNIPSEIKGQLGDVKNWVEPTIQAFLTFTNLVSKKSGDYANIQLPHLVSQITLKLSQIETRIQTLENNISSSLSQKALNQTTELKLDQFIRIVKAVLMNYSRINCVHFITKLEDGLQFVKLLVEVDSQSDFNIDDELQLRSIINGVSIEYDDNLIVEMNISHEAIENESERNTYGYSKLFKKGA
jgi:hypothetical protein